MADCYTILFWRIYNWWTLIDLRSCFKTVSLDCWHKEQNWNENKKYNNYKVLYLVIIFLVLVLICIFLLGIVLFSFSLYYFSFRFTCLFVQTWSYALLTNSWEATRQLYIIKFQNTSFKVWSLDSLNSRDIPGSYVKEELKAEAEALSVTQPRVMLQELNFT